MNTGLIAIAAAIAVALTGAFTALGQSRASAKAFESMARQPEITGKLQTAMIIALALMEALTIYGLLIAFMLVAKI
ncbi:MAG: ATP synthase F0 subunit C [Firmicutes bacterium]|nr:ATP synthase F0 subunit C [Bacillota bacterium]